MPTNLPPEAVEAEKRYREASTIPEQITCLEEYISAIPKHKGTDKLRADLRRRLSRLRESGQQKKSSRHVSVFNIDKEGAGQVVVVGPPNVGKSALVSALTHASPEVAAYPYTTQAPIPGMMPVENIQIQLVDTPPLCREHIVMELLDLIKKSDLILLVVDLQADPIQQIEDATALLEEHRIFSLQFEDRGAEPSRTFLLPMIALANKTDDESAEEDFSVFCELLGGDWPLIPVSATTGRNLDRLKEAVYDKLEIIRVYSKRPHKKPDLEEPFVLKKGSTLEDFTANVHQDFTEYLKGARIWGSGVFDGQAVSRDHVLHDGDVVELRI